jgi:hypothetical protein
MAHDKSARSRHRVGRDQLLQNGFDFLMSFLPNQLAGARGAGQSKVSKLTLRGFIMRALYQSWFRARYQQGLGCSGIQRERDSSLMCEPVEPLAGHFPGRPTRCNGCNLLGRYRSAAHEQKRQRR